LKLRSCLDTNPKRQRGKQDTSALPRKVLASLALRVSIFHSRSRAPALERTALEAPASCNKLARQEPRNKDINPHRVKS